MPRCTFCEHDNPPGAERCANCQAWLVQSARVAEAPPETQERVVAEPESGAAVAVEQSSQAFGMSAEQFTAVLQALASGNKIEAIKLLRQVTGLGLAEAKQASEALERMGGVLGALDPTQPAVEIRQEGGVTKIVRRQVIVGNSAERGDVQELLRQVAARRTQSSGCVTRVGVLLVCVAGLWCAPLAPPCKLTAPCI